MIDRQVSRRTVLKGLTAVGGGLALGGLAVPSPAAANAPAPRLPRFGVNYVPSRHWWYCWGDWDAKSIREDLTAVAELGFDHIRIQCLWPYFQPNGGYVSVEALDRLQQLLDVAGDADLDVQVTVLDGYLSGYTFLPAWAQGKNLLTDQNVIAAEKRLFAAMAERIGAHRRFLGFDLSNEIDNILGQQPGGVTTAQGDAWATELLDYCTQVAPGKQHVNGVSQNPWFYGYAFTRANMTSAGAHTIAHFYDFAVNGTSSPEHEAEYMVELVQAYATDPNRSVWLEEFGVSVGSGFGLSPDKLPDFIDAYIRNVVTCHNLWGATLWASHDLATSLTGFAGLEYGFGMLDTNNHPTPIGSRVAKVIADLQANPPASADRSTALVIPDDASPTLGAIGEPFTELITQQNIRPSLVLQSRSSDQAYLQARGITRLITLGEVAVLDGPSFPSLDDAFNNVGITDDTNIASGNFDLFGDSYSAQALAAAGVTPGATVTAARLSFTWPDVPAGQHDNLVVGGQVIEFADTPTGSTTLGFLGASTNGPTSCTVTVAYTDGTLTDGTLTFSDWTLNGGSGSPAPGNSTVATMPYRNCRNCGGRQSITTYLFAATLALDATKRIAKVGITSPTRGTINVFSIATG